MSRPHRRLLRFTGERSRVPRRQVIRFPSPFEWRRMIPRGSPESATTGASTGLWDSHPGGIVRVRRIFSPISLYLASGISGRSRTVMVSQSPPRAVTMHQSPTRRKKRSPLARAGDSSRRQPVSRGAAPEARRCVGLRRYGLPCLDEQWRVMQCHAAVSGLDGETLYGLPLQHHSIPVFEVSDHIIGHCTRFRYSQLDHVCLGGILIELLPCTEPPGCLGGA